MAKYANIVTYSPAITVVPTYECFNRCSYCNFRVDPLQDSWLSPSAVRERLAAARSQGMIEVLVLSGEVHPQSPRRRQWLQHIGNICKIAVEMGFLPHTNVGPLSRSEMLALKPVNVSMGLMLEQMTPDLLLGVHRHAPSKVPTLRLQQLTLAGQLRIPFTTGLLLGIGESENDRVETLEAIAQCHRKWGHIQEVILQPHQPGTYQQERLAAFDSAALTKFVQVARGYLPSDIVIQVPPNLIADRHHILTAIAYGARDLGGLGPVDEVNPDYDHPTPQTLAKLLSSNGWNLQPRLPIYPQYDHWLDQPLRKQVKEWRRKLDRDLIGLTTGPETISKGH